MNPGRQFLVGLAVYLGVLDLILFDFTHPVAAAVSASIALYFAGFVWVRTELSTRVRGLRVEVE